MPEQEFEDVCLEGAGLRSFVKIAKVMSDEGLGVVHFPKQVEGSEALQWTGQEDGLMERTAPGKFIPPLASFFHPLIFPWHAEQLLSTLQSSFHFLSDQLPGDFVSVNIITKREGKMRI